MRNSILSHFFDLYQQWIIAVYYFTPDSLTYYEELFLYSAGKSLVVCETACSDIIDIRVRNFVKTQTTRISS